MIGIFARLVGPKLAKPVFFSFVALLLISILSIGYCSLKSGERDQAKQTTRSSEAIASAANAAINDVVNQSEAATVIDAAVADVKEQVGNAQDPAAIASSITRSVCLRREYRNDPACKMQLTNPK